MVKILLACAGGMSSSMLMVRMRKAAVARHLDVKVWATGVEAVPDQVAKEHPDVIMIGPQVRFTIPRLRAHLSVPIAMIDFLDYGRMHGDAVLDAALALINDKTKK